MLQGKYRVKTIETDFLSLMGTLHLFLDQRNTFLVHNKLFAIVKQVTLSVILSSTITTQKSGS